MEALLKPASKHSKFRPAGFTTRLSQRISVSTSFKAGRAFHPGSGLVRYRRISLVRDIRRIGPVRAEHLQLPRGTEGHGLADEGSRAAGCVGRQEHLHVRTVGLGKFGAFGRDIVRQSVDGYGTPLNVTVPSAEIWIREAVPARQIRRSWS